MNPLLKHPVFQKLPYEILRNPTLENIKIFLAHRITSLKRLRYILALLFLLQGINVLFFSDPMIGENNYSALMDGIVNYISLFGLPIMAYGIYKQEKRCLMSDEEIMQEISAATQ